MVSPNLTQQEVLSNTILYKNLLAYCSRYPHDKERIFQIVSRRVSSQFDLNKIEICPPSDLYRARLCFIVSLFAPHAWKQAMERWKADAYFIIETNEELVAHVFQSYDFSSFLLNPHFHMLPAFKGEDIIAPLQRILRQTIYAGKLFLSQVLSPNDDEGIEKEYVDYAKNFNELLRKTVDHVYFNFGHIDDSIAGLKATFENSARIASSGGVTELENIYQGKPIAVIGAGPSLDVDLPVLVQNQDKFIIVAVDAAVKPLLKHGIRVDYVTTIERYNGFQEKFFEGLPSMEAELIAYPVVHKDVLACYPGSARLVYRNYAWYAYFERNWPLGILESGGSASHLASRLAIHLGASIVVLIGCDMSYEKHEQEDKWRSHCRETAYAEQWDHYKTEEEIRANEEFYGFYDVEANDGSQVKTHQIYHQWAKEYSSMILAYNGEKRVFTTAAKGVKTPRLEYFPLTKICSLLSPIDTSMKHPSNTRAMKEASHQTVEKNMRGFYETSKACASALEELIEAQKEGIQKPEALKLMHSIIYDKFVFDTFFTAFMIQNSAMEFFQAETKFYAIKNGAWSEDYDQRAWALLGIYRILQEISEKTLKVIEETRGGSETVTA